MPIGFLVCAKNLARSLGCLWASFGFRKRKEEQVEGSSAKGFDLARPGDC